MCRICYRVKSSKRKLISFRCMSNNITQISHFHKNQQQYKLIHIHPKTKTDRIS